MGTNVIVIMVRLTIHQCTQSVCQRLHIRLCINGGEFSLKSLKFGQTFKEEKKTPEVDFSVFIFRSNVRKLMIFGCSVNAAPV